MPEGNENKQLRLPHTKVDIVASHNPDNSEGGQNTRDEKEDQYNPDTPRLPFDDGISTNGNQENDRSSQPLTARINAGIERAEANARQAAIPNPKKPDSSQRELTPKEKERLDANRF